MTHAPVAHPPLAAGAGVPAVTSLFGRLVDGLSAIGSVLIAAIMVLMCADIVSREVLNRPIPGVTELVSLSIVPVLFLQLASALRHGRLSRAEIFIDGFRERRPRAGALMQSVLHACGAAFCAIVCVATVEPLRKAWTDNVFIGVEGVFTAPTWPVMAVSLLGSAVATVQFLLLALADLRIALGAEGARP